VKGISTTILAVVLGLSACAPIGPNYATPDVPVPDYWNSSIRAGLEMVEAARQLEAGWEVRVGIHMGPLVGGVIGQKQFSFDIWGDTVNIAARITDQAEPSGVLVSATIWRNSADVFEGRSKGMVELKGKGTLELIQCVGMA
jgi:adenylate cyclase